MVYTNERLRLSNDVLIILIGAFGPWEPIALLKTAG